MIELIWNKIGFMKKDLHDLLFAIWIDGQTAMIIRDEPGGTHHFEIVHNEKQAHEHFSGETSDKTRLFQTTLDNEKHDQNREAEYLHKFIKEVAHKVRYAHTIYIIGPGETRHLLQNELEVHKDLHNIIIQNSPAEKLSREEFEQKAKAMFSVL